MKLFKGKYRIETNRLAEYDYSQAGLYFITILTQERNLIFGNVIDGKMVLNDWGKTADKCWNEIPQHFPKTSLFESIIMPNHIHGIIGIWGSSGVETRHAVSLQYQPENFGKPTKHSIPTIIRSFKSATTKMINEFRNDFGKSIWQRGYYEHIIRNEDELNRIREYILTNPQNWSKDAYAE